MWIEVSIEEQRIPVEGLSIPSKAGDTLRWERLQERVPRSPEFLFVQSECEDVIGGLGNILGNSQGMNARDLGEEPREVGSVFAALRVFLAQDI